MNRLLLSNKTTMFNNGIFNYRTLLAYCGLLCVFGLFSPENDVWGHPFYARATWAGIALIFFGGLLVITLKVKGSNRHICMAQKLAPSAHENQDPELQHQMMTYLTTSPLAGAVMTYSSPMVNTDGTPMMENGMIDIMGKVYGEVEKMFEHDFESANNFSDSPFDNGMDMSHSPSSMW